MACSQFFVKYTGLTYPFTFMSNRIKAILICNLYSVVQILLQEPSLLWETEQALFDFQSQLTKE